MREGKMTKNHLDLLRSYGNGPKIWDATAMLPDVYALEAKGLVEQVGHEGFLYQLTGAGRTALVAELRAALEHEESRLLMKVTFDTRPAAKLRAEIAALNDQARKS
jgi:hypothetical protein